MNKVEPKLIESFIDKSGFKLLPLSSGGRVGKTTENNKEASALYRRTAAKLASQ